MSTIKSTDLVGHPAQASRRRAWSCIMLLATSTAIALVISACQPIQPIQPIQPQTFSGSAYAAPVAPQSLGELVANKPLIMIATVGPIVGTLDHASYDTDGALVTEGVTASGAPLPPAPVTDFALVPKQTLRDDGSVANDRPIILRVAGSVTKELADLTKGTDFALPWTGDEYLFLLSPTPDGAAYGMWSAWHMLTVAQDNRLILANGQPLRFGDSGATVTVDDLVELLN